MTSDLELASHIAVAAALGALLGLERERRGQVAGMRTHALVAVGAAIFTIAGAYGFESLDRGPSGDPMRVAAQVASGIGFIGAGAILREGAAVRGLTTAAGLWTAAAIGMATGAGMLAVAAVSTVLILVLLVGLGRVRLRVLDRFGGGMRIVTVDYEQGHGTLAPVLDRLRDAGAQVHDITIEDAGDTRRRSVSLTVRTPRPEDLDAAIAELAALEEVHDAAVRPAPS